MSETGIEYDEGLRERLDLAALRRLRQGYAYRVDCETAAEHHTCLRFVTLHGLAYDWRPDDGEFIIYPPA